MAYYLKPTLNLGQCSQCIPTDGDIEDIAPYMETENAHTWPQWFEILGEPPKGIRYNSMLRLAEAAARRDMGGEGSVRVSPKFDRRMADLTGLIDKVDSVAASQIPMIDSFERMTAAVERLGPQNRFKLEENLKRELGERIYSSLCDDAKIALLDAERRYCDRDTIDWNSVTAGFAKAFELQLKQCFLPKLADFLKNRNILRFPNGDRLPNGNEIWPIINRGKVETRSTLGAISNALSLKKPELEDFVATMPARRRSRSAAKARQARRSSRVRSGKSFRISSSLMPDAR